MKQPSSYIYYTIAKYIIKPYYKLSNFWKQYKNNISFASFNNTKSFEWIHINFSYYIHYNTLLGNPSNWAYYILKNKHNIVNKFDKSLSSNDLPYYINEISLQYLSFNPSPWAYKIIKHHLNKFDWKFISNNSSFWAYKLLKKNPNKINANNYKYTLHIK